MKKLLIGFLACVLFGGGCTKTTPQKETISVEEAKNIAYADAGVEENEIEHREEENDGDHVIQFEAGEGEYEYEVDRVTGEIEEKRYKYTGPTKGTLDEPLWKESSERPGMTNPVEPIDPPVAQGGESDEVAPVDIAMAHANVNDAISLEETVKEGVVTVTFSDSTTEYTYTIESKTGRILSWNHKTK